MTAHKEKERVKKEGCKKAKKPSLKKKQELQEVLKFPIEIF